MNKLAESTLTWLGFGIGIVSLPFLKLEALPAIIIILIGLSLSLFVHILFLYKRKANDEKKFQKLIEDLESVTKNRDTLIPQYDEKQRMLVKYEQLFFRLRNTIALAMSHPKEAKLIEIAKTMDFEFEQINLGGISDEHNQ